MEYQIGCNYWASHAGTEMWARWDEAVVERDIEALVKNAGVRCLRVFPNWRDFQPIQMQCAGGGEQRQYTFANFAPLPNEYGLDPLQLEHFSALCRIADRYQIKLIVGLVTGFMSGMLYAPPALNGKNLIADPECLMWQHRFVKGFVAAFRQEKCILAWDLGNECNNLGRAANAHQAYLWTLTVSNAIRVADESRQIISGMHSLAPDGCWSFRQQGELTDIVTPHPYPSVFSKRDTEPLNELSTTMYPTAQALYYAGLSGKPSMIEETGTFNKILGNDCMAADYMRTTLWSSWANGSTGTLWWCAFDQGNLHFPPYDWNMCENELGLLGSDYTVKKQADAMRNFVQSFEALPIQALPPRDIDAVCILTREQDTLLVSLSATVLSKQAGFEISFVYHDQPLPEAPVYMLPSLNGHDALSVSEFRRILTRVEAGAALYLSLDEGLIVDVENVCGLIVNARQKRRASSQVSIETPIGEVRFLVKDGMELNPRLTTAQALGSDQNGRVVFSKNSYGKGTVYLLSAPLEKMLASAPGSFCDENMPAYYGVYRTFTEQVRKNKIAASRVPGVAVTQHMCSKDTAILIAINYTGHDLPIDFDLDPAWRLTLIHGSPDMIVPHNDAVVYSAKKR